MDNFGFKITVDNEMLKPIQKELDEKKYYESEIARQDLSGKMEYCKYCTVCYQSFRQCPLDQHTRETNCVCAKAELKRVNLVK